MSSNCENPNCDGEWVTEPPLQDGGMASVYQCPDCSAKARREAEETDRRQEHLRIQGRAAGNMYAHLADEL